MSASSFVAGLAVGAAATFIAVSLSDRETRGMIYESVQEGVRAAKQTSQEFSAKAQNILDQGQEHLEREARAASAAARAAGDAYSKAKS